MEDIYRENSFKCLRILQQEIKSADIIPKLRDHGCLSSDEENDISLHRGSELLQNSKLLEILLNKDPSKKPFGKLCQALEETGQKIMVDVIKIGTQREHNDDHGHHEGFYHTLHQHVEPGPSHQRNVNASGQVLLTQELGVGYRGSSDASADGVSNVIEVSSCNRLANESTTGWLRHEQEALQSKVLDFCLHNLPKLQNTVLSGYPIQHVVDVLRQFIACVNKFLPNIDCVTVLGDNIHNTTSANAVSFHTSSYSTQEKLQMFSEKIDSLQGALQSLSYANTCNTKSDIERLLKRICHEVVWLLASIGPGPVQQVSHLPSENITEICDVVKRHQD